MIGTVEYVSEFPASLNGMVAVLPEPGACYGTFSSIRSAISGTNRAHAGCDDTERLRVDVAASHSVLEITPGTLATVEIRASTQSPAALVLPWIKEKLSH